jgi:hypothetical protein
VLGVFPTLKQQACKNAGFGGLEPENPEKMQHFLFPLRQQSHKIHKVIALSLSLSLSLLTFFLSPFHKKQLKMGWDYPMGQARADDEVDIRHQSSMEGSRSYPEYCSFWLSTHTTRRNSWLSSFSLQHVGLLLRIF